MKKIVVVPMDAEIIPSANGHAFLAGILLKVTAFWMNRLVKLMGEPAALVALEMHSCAEITAEMKKAVADKGVESTPAVIPPHIRQMQEDARLIAEKNAAEMAESARKEAVKAQLKPSEKGTKKPLKKVLRPTVPAGNGETA